MFLEFPKITWKTKHMYTEWEKEERGNTFALRMYLLDYINHTKEM